MYFFVTIFIIIVIAYFLYLNFDVQVFLHRRKLRSSFIKSFTKEVNGKFYKRAFFAKNHKIVSKKEHNIYYARHKASFNTCYNCVTFKTQDASWELFFYLIKDGPVYSEIMSIRVFPNKVRIKSQGNVERTLSRVNVLTNNRYLTDLLEDEKSQEYLSWLLRKNDDNLLISHNTLHFKSFIKSKKMSVKKTLNSVKAINALKNIIYKKGVIEY